MENKKKELDRIQILSPLTYSQISPSSKSFKVRSPKSFIKKIKSSGSLTSIPLVRSTSNLSQKSNRSDIHEEECKQQYDFDDFHSSSVGLDIDNENQEDDLFKTISSMNHNQEVKIVKKVKVKNLNSQCSKEPNSKNTKDILKKKKKMENEDDEESGDENKSESDRKNQLFTIEPSFDFVKKIMELFLGKNINNPYYQFSRKMLEDKKIVEEMVKLVPELKEYYLKCKHTKYLEKIDSKKCITIFRQLLRIHGYKVNSTEKYQNGSKFLLYQVEKQKVGKMSPKKINFTIDFD